MIFQTCDDRVNQLIAFLVNIRDELIHPLDTPFEYTEWISNGDFESVVMRYCHGDCLDMVLMLIEKTTEQSISFSQSFNPVLIYGSDKRFIHAVIEIKTVTGKIVYLDMNGIHSKDTLIDFLSAFESKENLKFEQHDPVDFYDDYANENTDDTNDDALASFNLWLDFVKKNVYSNRSDNDRYRYCH